MIARYSVSLSLGAAVTFGLLFVMQALIATGHNALSEAPNFQLRDFVRVEHRTIIDTTRKLPEELPEPADPPELPGVENIDESRGGVDVRIPGPRIRESIQTRDVRFELSDGEQLPIVKVTPVYPSRALSRGIEGYVIVEFTVTRTGMVRDVSVVESTNGVFDRAAIEAASKFRYKPRVIDGEAVDVSGVRNKITFEISR